MSTPAPDSGQQATKIRSIEVALNSFQSRVQASLSSHVETLKSKMEIVASKVNPSVSELNKPQLSVGDLRKVAEEIDRIVQKDLLEDTTKLINEKFVEFNGLVSGLETRWWVLATSNNQTRSLRSVEPALRPIWARC